MDDFKFEFAASDDEHTSTNCYGDSTADDDGDGPESCEMQWTATDSDRQKSLQSLPKVQHTIGSYELLTLAATAVEDYLLHENEGASESNDGVIKAISGHSDLVAGQYEGGLKVWECSLDLCRYLLDSAAPVKGSNVLELGCGAGLPGILAAKMGAASVHFQDFNKEVIESYTMANVQLNSIDESSCSFFSGDWGTFAVLGEGKKYRYDLILTSETIYNVKSYRKLLKVFSTVLTKAGSILVAAKSDYFGVGGSVSSFTEFIRSSQQFEIEVAKHIETGIPRKILKLTRSS